MNIKVILTGATGMVGEGVLLECLDHPAVTTAAFTAQELVRLNPNMVFNYVSGSATAAVAQPGRPNKSA